MTFREKFAASATLALLLVCVGMCFIWLDRKVLAEPVPAATAAGDFALSPDTQFAIFRIWSAHYDDEAYAPQFARGGSMADAVFRYLLARNNELHLREDRYPRSKIYEPGPLPDDGIVVGGQ